MDRRTCTVCAMTPTETDPADAMAAAASKMVAQLRAVQLAGLRKIVPDLTEAEAEMLRSVAAQYHGADLARLMTEAYRAGVERGRELEHAEICDCESQGDA